MANYPLVPEEEPPQDCTFDFPGLWWFEHLQTPFFFFSSSSFFFFVFVVISWLIPFDDIRSSLILISRSVSLCRSSLKDCKRSVTWPNNWHLQTTDISYWVSSVSSVLVARYATDEAVQSLQHTICKLAPWCSVAVRHTIWNSIRIKAMFQCSNTGVIYFEHGNWWKRHPVVILKVFCDRWWQLIRSHMIPTLSGFVISLRTNIKKEVSWIKNFYLPLVLCRFHIASINSCEINDVKKTRLPG